MLWIKTKIKKLKMIYVQILYFLFCIPFSKIDSGHFGVYSEYHQIIIKKIIQNNYIGFAFETCNCSKYVAVGN